MKRARDTWPWRSIQRVGSKQSLVRESVSAGDFEQQSDDGLVYHLEPTTNNGRYHFPGVGSGPPSVALHHC